MIQAILGIVLAAWLAYGLVQILTGLFQIFTGIFLCVTGAMLYVLSFVVEYTARAVRFLWRSF